ncbi:DUF982 domain-containing protein [Mesorhizobium sp. B3-1-9]|uniref:DUF982 domain-containing protein n=1 Tax=Mesorhizobium sp. B3-1-9 TaxID=2589892 RepID=UPI001FED6D67|nr:DUF982 domain-containing protein [Mesorhizobium sp. B3-1-9]
MNVMTGEGTVPAPACSPSEFLAYEEECRTALKPLLTGLLDMAESAGWNRRTVTSTLILSAHVARHRECLRRAEPDARISRLGRIRAGRRVVLADRPVARHAAVATLSIEAQVMTNTRFEQPVTILVGMGFPVTIENAMEACSLLQDWPAPGRNGAHAVALNACKAGIAGEVDPEIVRATLVAFARRNDILVPNTLVAKTISRTASTDRTA